MLPDIFNLTGKVAWITGGSKGLGFQMANTLAAAGASIALNSRHADEAETAAHTITETHGVKTFAGAVDVSRADDVRPFADQIVKNLGSLDILINNAGINVRLPTAELPVADWQRVVDINLTGPFLCSQAAIPHMVSRGWGRILHVSSMLGLVGLAARPAYTATKGALVLLAKAQALELASTGVTVNALCPGPFATEMNKPLLDDPEKYRAFVAKIPLGRWGELHELDGPVLFLTSHASSFVTGTTLVVDGGWTAQ
jgi:NAD(P)-dependent dehydrogenase (short-subunit alcohol dehydrogenase family)